MKQLTGMERHEFKSGEVKLYARVEKGKGNLEFFDIKDPNAAMRLLSGIYAERIKIQGREENSELIAEAMLAVVKVMKTPTVKGGFGEKNRREKDIRRNFSIPSSISKGSAEGYVNRTLDRVHSKIMCERFQDLLHSSRYRSLNDYIKQNPRRRVTEGKRGRPLGPFVYEVGGGVR